MKLSVVDLWQLGSCCCPTRSVPLTPVAWWRRQMAVRLDFSDWSHCLEVGLSLNLEVFHMVLWAGQGKYPDPTRSDLTPTCCSYTLELRQSIREQFQAGLPARLGLKRRTGFAMGICILQASSLRLSKW